MRNVDRGFVMCLVVVLFAYIAVSNYISDNKIQLLEERVLVLEEHMETMMNLTTDDGMICAYDCKEN